MKLKPKKRINSWRKGKEGELELVHFLEGLGYAARRGRQFKGGTGSPDVVCEGLDGLHIECKYVEAGSPYKWLEQSIRDAGPIKVPTVMHKRNRKEWLIILRLEDFLAMLKGATHGQAHSD